jgi:hypothetical protein
LIGYKRFRVRLTASEMLLIFLSHHHLVDCYCRMVGASSCIQTLLFYQNVS